MIDTNFVSETVRALIAENQKISSWSSTIREILPGFVVVMGAIVVWYQKRQDDKLKAHAVKLAENTQVVEETKTVAKEIARDVNSERTKMIEKLEIMNTAFTDVAKENAIFREQKRVSDAAIIAAAIASESVTSPKVDLSDIKAMLESMVASEVSKLHPK